MTLVSSIMIGALAASAVQAVAAGDARDPIRTELIQPVQLEEEENAGPYLGSWASICAASPTDVFVDPALDDVAQRQIPPQTQVAIFGGSVSAASADEWDYLMAYRLAENSACWASTVINQPVRMPR